MMSNHSIAGLALCATLLGTGLTSAFAADETLRSLAEKNNIYVGAILNSQWFNGGLPGNYEQIHKTQFNIVVADSATAMVTRWSSTRRLTACASAAMLSLGTARFRTG